MNKAFINRDGFIEVVYVGPQTASTIAILNTTCRELVTRLRAQGQQSLILADLTALGPVQPAARQQSAKDFKDFDFDRLALYGSSRFFQVLTKLAVNAFGHSRKVMTFRTREEAIAWLQGTAKKPKINLEHKLKPRTLAEYQAFVDGRLADLRDILSLATIGEYSKDLPIPEEDDEFIDIFVAIRLLVETLRERDRKP